MKYESCSLCFLLVLWLHCIQICKNTVHFYIFLNFSGSVKKFDKLFYCHHTSSSLLFVHPLSKSVCRTSIITFIQKDNCDTNNDQKITPSLPIVKYLSLAFHYLIILILFLLTSSFREVNWYKCALIVSFIFHIIRSSLRCRWCYSLLFYNCEYTINGTSLFNFNFYNNIFYNLFS